MRRTAILAMGFLWFAGGAAAQPVAPLRLSCDFARGIARGASDVWVIDLSNSTARFADWERTIPASISEDAIVWEYSDDDLTHLYYVNRYTGALRIHSTATSGETYTNLGQCRVVQERAF